jgi:DNA-directed RNA polymerase I, II, and III subunit RPABC4
MSGFSDAAFADQAQPAAAAAAPAGGGGAFATGFEDSASAGLDYICGDCGFRQQMKKLQTCRCVACGYRILYKARTKRLVTFQAR